VFTCTNSKIPSFLDRPPGKIIERHPGLGLKELLREFMKNRPDKPMLPIKPMEFAPRFEQYHKELMEWQTQVAEINDKLRRELREEFLAKANWSAVEWDRNQNRIVIIFDEMRESDLVNAYYSFLPSSDEEENDPRKEQIEAIASQLPRIAAFERLIQEIPLNPPFEKVLELTSPVPATVYLSPENPMNEEE
jgi:hypothetical protein